MTTIGDNYGAHLRQIIERIERLAEEKQAIADDIKDVYAKAKGSGYDTKALRKLIVERKRRAVDVAEEQAVLQMYREAIKMPEPGVD